MESVVSWTRPAKGKSLIILKIGQDVAESDEF